MVSFSGLSRPYSLVYNTLIGSRLPADVTGRHSRCNEHGPSQLRHRKPEPGADSSCLHLIAPVPLRAHLGVETQRQWSDLAILRATPTLSGLFSLIALWMQDLARYRAIGPKTTAWYPKACLTFSDALAAVRREIWNHRIFSMSRFPDDAIKIPRLAWDRIVNAVAYAR